MNNSNDVHNESFQKKIPKKKKFGQISIVLNTNTEEKTFEKDIEQNISDFSEIVKTKKKSINASENIMMKKNEFDAIKKLRKKSKYIKSLNLMECSTNKYTKTKMFEKSGEKVGEQNIIDFYTKNNINPKTKSKVNALEYHKTSEKVSEQDINNSGSWKNLNQTLKTSELKSSDISLEHNSSINNNRVVTKKLKKKKKHNKSLNSIELKTNNDIEIKSFEKTYKEDEEPNNINSWNNISQKRKYKINALADIDNVPTKKLKKKKNHDNTSNANHDTEDITFEEIGKQTINDSKTINCYIDNENVQIKGPKKKKHNKNFISIELNTNNDIEIKSVEKTYKEDEQKINDSSFRGNMSEKINLSSDISLENNSSINNDSVVIKKKKKHNKNFNSIELNTNNDIEIKSVEKTYKEDEQKINDSSFRGNLSEKINLSSDTSLENNSSIINDSVVTKRIKKKKKHNKSLNSIELNTNNDIEIKSVEKTYKEDEQKVNDSSFRGNISEKINLSSDISLENNSSINNDSMVIKKKKKHNKSLNFIEVNTNNDIEIKSVEKTYEEVEPNINESDFRENISRNINLSSENNTSINNDNIVTEKLKKKKKPNTNSTQLNTKNDLEMKSFEKICKQDEEPNTINSWNNICQKRKYKINALADIDNVPTKKLKKKKIHDNTLNVNHDTEDITFEEVDKQNINDSETINCNNDDENVQTEGPKKKKKHNKGLNPLKLNTIHDSKIDTINRTNLKSDESILNSSIKISMSNSKKFKVNNVYTQNIVEDYNCNMSQNEKIIPVVSENYSLTDLSQNYSKLKNLLNSMESNDFEGASTKIETKFNLIKYLKYKEASLQNHPKFKQIMQMLSKKIKDIVNKNCQITNADIVLLKTVGNIILEKIVEKMNAAQDINDIIITLPPECKENKIHFIETSLGRPPSKEKMNIIKKLNPHVKLRVFNIEEDNLIREYWSKFQKEYKISNILPFLSNGLEMVLNNTQKLQFVRYISAGLPNRLLSSVFNRFNVLFNGNQDKTRFSEEEDQLIMKVEKCDVIKRKLSVLSLILNRSRMQLYRRHGVLKNQFEKCKKVCWDDQKRQELFTNILLETNTDNWKDLKNLTLKKNTLIKIAENLGEDVTFEKVRKQWNYLYTMLFCEKPIKMLSLRLKILKLLEQQNFKHFSDVNWIKITNQLYPGANSKLICDFFYEWINKNVPSNLKKNIKDTLNYLREHNVDKIRKTIHKHGEREFPRLTVQDYDLLVVIDD